MIRDAFETLGALVHFTPPVLDRAASQSFRAISGNTMCRALSRIQGTDSRQTKPQKEERSRKPSIWETLFDESRFARALGEVRLLVGIRSCALRQPRPIMFRLPSFKT